MEFTSSALRCSIGICLMRHHIKSMVGDGQCNIERHAVILRGKRLQIGTDLVADIAIGCHPVGSDKDEVDHAMLHEMAAGVVAMTVCGTP